MTKKGWIYLAVALLLLWLLLGGHDRAGELAADVAKGKVPAVPDFGTDAILDAADATATLHLQPPPVLLPLPSPPVFPPNYIGKIS